MVDAQDVWPLLALVIVLFSIFLVCPPDDKDSGFHGRNERRDE